MGKAYGQLMATEIRQNLNAMLEYLYEQGGQVLDFLPKFMRKLLTKSGLNIWNSMLDLNYQVTRAYTPKRYKQQMKGIAAGAGFSYRKIRNANLIPELTRASCTIVGAWGKATLNNKVYQLRALDWNKQAPITKYPTAIIYHSSESGSQVYANIGFAGFIGTISAQSNAGIGISEKVWMPEKSENAHYSYLGKPWALVLRDLVQFETKLQGAINTLN